MKFVSPSDEEYASLERDIKRRLFEGRGEAFYELGLGGMSIISYDNTSQYSFTDSTASGLTEDELSASLATLNSLAVSCNADMSVLRKKPADKGFTVECLVRQRAAEDDFMEVRYEEKPCKYMIVKHHVSSCVCGNAIH